MPNKFLKAADDLAAESNRAKVAKVNRYLKTVEDKAEHIERIGYLPKKELWNAGACEAREWGSLRHLETTASHPVYVVYDKETHSLVKV